MTHDTAEPATTQPNILVFDFETTGLDIVEDAPVSYAAAKLGAPGQAHRILGQGYCNPGRPIGAGATAIHGISDADVQYGPRWPATLQDMAAVVSVADAVMCFNAGFDVAMLLSHAHQHGVPVSLPPVLCPLVWARTRWWRDRGADQPRDPRTGKPRLRLVDVAGYYGVQFTAHDAAQDVIATCRVARRVLGEVVAIGKWSAGGKTGPDALAALGAWTAEKGRQHDRMLAMMDKRKGRTPQRSGWEVISAWPDRRGW